MTDSRPAILTADSYRPLGDSDIKVSTLGLGTVKFGRNIGLKYPSDFSLPTDLELALLLDRAKELGINFLDTAPAYGTSEERLGKLIRGSRDQWVVSTKVGERFADGISHYDFSAKSTIQSLEDSLRKLNTDYLDLVLIHCNKQDVDNLNNTEVIPILRLYQQKGYIRLIGESTNSVEAGILSITELDTVMITYNQHEKNQAAVISRAEQLGKGLLLKKVLGSGHASDASEALRFAMSSSAISSAVIGTISPIHLSRNVETLARITSF